MTAGTKKFRLTMSTFNVIKGFSMVGIVLAHMMYRYPVEELVLPLRLVYAVLRLTVSSLPMFFLISGYGFKEKPLGKFFKASVSSMLKPYLIAAVVFCLSYPVIYRLWFGDWYYAKIEVSRYLMAFLLGVPKPGKMIPGFEYSLYHCTAVWFFLASFWASNILNVLLKLKNGKLRLLIVLLLVVAGYGLLIYDLNFFCFAQGLMATGYFYLGYILKKKDLFARWMEKPATYAVLVPVAVFFTFFCNFNLCLGLFRFGILDFFASCCAGILLMYLGVYVQRFEGKFVEALDSIGVYTYWILSVHAVENDCIPWWDFALDIPNVNLGFAGELIIKAAIIGCGCVVLKKISYLKYKRSKLRNGK